MVSGKTAAPNPKRVAAGKRNRALWKGLSEEGRRRLRESALRHKPWQFATGPRTPQGKARCAQNGKKRQRGPKSVRQLRAQAAEIRALVRQLQECRLAAQRT